MSPDRGRGNPKDESAVFEEAMADVRRLERDTQAPEIRYREPVTISQHEREVLRELDLLVSSGEGEELQDPDEHLEGKVAGLDPRVMKQLRRGEFTVQADLDLHGTDSESARRLVEQFLVSSHARDLRCVRIVHGRGRGSPDRVPVLKQNLPRWLARGPAAHIVLGYASATPRDGGAGASYVLLRRRR